MTGQPPILTPLNLFMKIPTFSGAHGDYCPSVNTQTHVECTYEEKMD